MSKQSSPFRVRWTTTIPALVLLALAVHAFLPRLASLEEAAKTLHTLRWWAVALAIAAQAASNAAGGFMINQIARLTGDRLSIGRSVRLGLAASCVGLVAGGPIGYAAALYYWLKREGVSSQGATLLGWLPAILNATALASSAMIGVFYIVFVRGLGSSLPFISAMIAIVVPALMLGLVVRSVRDERAIVALVTFGHRVWSKVRRRPLDMRALSHDRRRAAQARRSFAHGGWRGPVAGAVLNVAFDVLSFYLLFLAAGFRIRPGTLIAGYGLPEVVGRLSFIPGGIGIIEGGMVGLYSALGVPAGVGVVAVLAYRALSFWLPTATGAVFAVSEQRRVRRSRRVSTRPVAVHSVHQKQRL